MKIWIMCAAALATTPSLVGDPAAPDEQGGLCYETIGCVQDRMIDQPQAEQLGCDQLWTARNGIYHARGFCFKTDRGRQEFGNENCSFDDEAQAPLNDYERANVKLIRPIEQRRGC
jgi:hypothetical protein